MLPAQNRLKSEKAFDDLFRKGKTFSNDMLILKVSKNSECGPAKIGFAVGLKFSKKASQRNLVKRWLREAVKAQLKKIKSGNTIIFVMKPSRDTNKPDGNILRENVKKMLIKANLLES